MIMMVTLIVKIIVKLVSLSMQKIKVNTAVLYTFI